MDATAEGIGGRKWSYQDKPGEGGMERVLSQGALEIAVLREHPRGHDVTARLWPFNELDMLARHQLPDDRRLSRHVDGVADADLLTDLEAGKARDRDVCRAGGNRDLTPGRRRKLRCCCARQLF